MSKKQSAFTLVEAIVSVALLSILLTIVYGVFFSVTRSTVAGAEASIEIQRQRSDNAIARTTLVLFGLYSLIALWACDLVTDSTAPYAAA